MTKRRKPRKNDICSYSGKRTANREVILSEYAVEFVRKQGYLVTNFKVS